MELLFLPIGAMGLVFTVAPFTALLVSGGFAFLYLRRRGWIVLSTTCAPGQPPWMTSR